MSSACSTSYNIHEAQHLIPACPFNGCRYPVVAERLVSLAILATASDYLQPSEIYTHTHGQTRTHTHAVWADTHSPCRPLPWIYQSRDCKLWSIINSDGVRQWRYREMVKQGAFLTSALYFNWQPCHNFPIHRGTTSIHHWSSCMSIGIRAWSRVPNVIMRKLGDVAAHALRFNT